MTTRRRHQVVIVGAGPVGLTAAIDLLRRGIDVLLLETRGDLSEGSRAICFAKRTLEIFSRLGAGAAMLEKGVTWERGKVFHRESLLYEFNLAAEKNSHPAFINLQQYYCEEYLLHHLQSIAPNALMRGWRVTRVTHRDECAEVIAEDSNGNRLAVMCEYVIACDGAKSALRAASGIAMIGEEFRDRFLISDIKMRSDFPSERWFWFDPPFHPGRSALLHKQPDNIWRIDLQLGWHADPLEERKAENVLPRLRAMLGGRVKFDLQWTSVYTFQSCRMQRFDSGRVFFAGDAAHQVSPFGARGANSGVQDVDNLCWKIAYVLRNGASDALLATYNSERVQAADENILHSSRSTRFIAPSGAAAQAFRDASLRLAQTHSFARGFVNSGRLSTATSYCKSPLNGGDDFADNVGAAAAVGAAAPDMPINGEWLLPKLRDDFNCLIIADAAPADTLIDECAKHLPLHCHTLRADSRHTARQRFGLDDSAAVVLLRPDGHICGKWRADSGGMPAALQRAAATAGNIIRKGAAQ